MSTINSPLDPAAQSALYERGYEIYKKDGQGACEEFARQNGITTTAECEACESEEPVIVDEKGEISCFVCGSVIGKDSA